MERRRHSWLRGLDAGSRARQDEGDSVIVKKYPSGFFGTTLATELNVRNVDTVVLCGVSTSGCVRASALDAMCYGFRPMVSFSNPRKWKMIWANEGKIGRCRSMRRSHG
jgi:nicotinamidase-related amidase